MVILPSLIVVALSGTVDDFERALGEVSGVDFDQPELGFHLLNCIGDAERAKLLIKAGMDVNCRNAINLPAGWGGGRKGWNSPDVARVLLDAGADVNYRYRHGSLLCHIEEPETVQLLIEKGARVNARGYRRMTPLFFAGSVAVAKTLIDNGANVDAKDRRRMTADEYRRQVGLTDVADFIRTKREQLALRKALPQAAEGSARTRRYI